MSSSPLDTRLADNRAALAELLVVAEDIPRVRWLTPLREKAWSPAQHILHVSMAYEALIRDVRDGQPARLIGAPWQRIMWRWFSFPLIFWRGRLPRGARAPREMRPPETSATLAHLAAELRSNVDEFERVVRAAADASEPPTIRHPYFGGLSLQQGVTIAAVHARHHAALLRVGVEPAAA